MILLFEAVADNTFEVVARFTGPPDSESIESANVADVDGDGRQEIVIERNTTVTIYENTAENTWVECWSADVVYFGAKVIFAGDHDQDGKE